MAGTSRDTLQLSGSGERDTLQLSGSGEKWLKARQRSSSPKILIVPDMKKAKKTSTPAAEWLNDDLVEFCILPRVPVKSLMRFKCVSKKWHCMISTPHHRFIHLQFRYASSGILLHSQILRMLKYVSKDTGNIDIPKSKYPINEISSWIVASCNGLVCIVNQSRLKLFIGNPFLEDWKQLPYHWGYHRSTLRMFSGMAVDVGETSVRYKLVVSKELEINGLKEYEFHIFSSTSEQWKVVKKRIKLESSDSDFGVYVMGSMYWRFRRYHDYVVLRFSLEEEEYSLQPLPRGAKDGQIGECSGKLSYTMFREGEIEMWSLDQSQWSKRLSINFENCTERKLKSLVPPSHKMQLRWKKPYTIAYEVIMLPFEGGDVFTFLVDGTVYFYDIKTGEILRKLDPRKLDPWYQLAGFPYKDTIVPLPGKIQEMDYE